MELVTDLEIHSKYARAVSKNMTIPEMAKWAAWKGIDIVGTGDFTHPEWMNELQQNLVEEGNGLLKYGQGSARFMLTAEVSSIFSQGGRGRRVHTIIVAPSFIVAKRITEKLGQYGKLSADGRPIIGASCKRILQDIIDTNQEYGLTDDPHNSHYRDKAGAFIIPAHVWTPWFGLYGSKSGFDSLEECFEELTPHVRAIETGLSSDPPMNWRLADNDRVALVSFSDAHSAPNMMREATVVTVRDKTYSDVAQALQNPNIQGVNHISYTVEFFPEEGKYHYDGIADEKLRLSPQQRMALEQTDPKLAKKVTVGVLSRVEDLADRKESYRPKDRPVYKSIIPLQEIIADTFKVRKQSKKVQTEYERLVSLRTEFDILLKCSESELRELTSGQLVKAVIAVRQGEVDLEPGYDGLYGTIKIRA